MLWVKTFHILFVMSWMAGIFYLPRIFVHFVEGQAAGEQVDRLAIMARKLYGFMTVMMVLALVSGVVLWLVYGFAGGWLHVKLVFVCYLMVYHFWATRQDEGDAGRAPGSRWCLLSLGQRDSTCIDHRDPGDGGREAPVSAR